MFQLEDKHWWFLAKREFIKTFLPFPKGNFKILDLGCGTGGLSKFLQKWGSVLGVEKEKTAAGYLRYRKITYLSKAIDTCRFSPQSFDLICIFDVLYHKNIKNDLVILKKAHRWLKTGGLLCLTDSAIPLLFSKHDIIMQGRERYTLGKMEAKLQQAGFSILKKSYIYCLLFPLFVVSRLINKYVNFATVGKVNPFVNRILLNICRMEAGILKSRRLPIGSSILFLAKKKHTWQQFLTADNPYINSYRPDCAATRTRTGISGSGNRYSVH